MVRRDSPGPDASSLEGRCHPSGPVLSRPLILLMAAAGGLTVAGIYYNQPLLVLLQHDFGAGAAEVGAIPVVTQLGYALGMLFLVPLGDMLERRSLILYMNALLGISLLAAGAAPSLLLLVIAHLAIGLTAMLAQLILPLAADLAPPDKRGGVVGTIMSGLLLGILLARTVSGLIAGLAGWRTVYFVAGAAMLVQHIALWRLLPVSDPHFKGTYSGLLRSILTLVKEQRTLRESALIGGCLFGSFSAFWATLVFFLAGPPYGYGPEKVGLFGLVGAAGALAAPVIGKLADRRGPRFTLAIALTVVALSFALFWAGGHVLVLLVLGVVLMDLGVQSGHISNQTRVFSLVPGARSRLNTVYMFSYFIGGALGSALGVTGWRIAGWSGVCVVSLMLTSAAWVAFSRGN